MQMGAIPGHYSYKNAIISAINAGCDMLIISNNGKIYDEKAPYEAIVIIYKAIKNGSLSLKRVSESPLRE